MLFCRYFRCLGTFSDDCRHFKPITVFLEFLKSVLDPDKSKIIVRLEFFKIVEAKRYRPVNMYIRFIYFLIPLTLYGFCTSLDEVFIFLEVVGA